MNREEVRKQTARLHAKTGRFALESMCERPNQRRLRGRLQEMVAIIGELDRMIGYKDEAIQSERPMTAKEGDTVGGRRGEHD